MNKFFLALLVSISLPAVAADDDYAKVRKDVSVMAKIIKGAFEESKDCKKCNPRIETTYLAKQGAVFRVKPSSWTSFTSSFTGDGDYSFVVPPVEPVEGVRAIQIREFVGDVLDDVGVVLSDVGDQLDMEFGDIEIETNDHRVHIDSETRSTLRELNRERRELEYQLREHEIELIHADKEERKEIYKNIARVEKEIIELEKKQSALSKEYEKEKQELKQRILAKKEKAKQAAVEELNTYENIVLRSFCDYGSTLKNLPDAEFVSVVFTRPGNNAEKVVILEKDDIDNCRDVKSLKSKALTYQY